MKKIARTFVIGLILTVLTWTAAYAESYIRVGSFNIANFGSSVKGEYERSLVSLVNIILEMNADISAFQGVEPTEQGTKQVETTYDSGSFRVVPLPAAIRN